MDYPAPLWSAKSMQCKDTMARPSAAPPSTDGIVAERIREVMCTNERMMNLLGRLNDTVVKHFGPRPPQAEQDNDPCSPGTLGDLARGLQVQRTLVTGIEILVCEIEQI